MYYTVAISLVLLLFRSSDPSAFLTKPSLSSSKVLTATPKPEESNNNAETKSDDPLASPSMFDLIVGTGFNSEADKCREVGGDPWFLGQDEE
jgi:hypothetical protein